MLLSEQLDLGSRHALHQMLGIDLRRVVEAGRYRYAISNHLALAWFNRDRPAEQRLHALGEISADLIACIVRDEPDVPTQALLRALVQMRQDGEFDAIFSRYR